MDIEARYLTDKALLEVTTDGEFDQKKLKKNRLFYKKYNRKLRVIAFIKKLFKIG